MPCDVPASAATVNSHELGDIHFAMVVLTTNQKHFIMNRRSGELLSKGT